MVHHFPWRAKPRNRCPFGPHPRSGAISVLIHVSSMKRLIDEDKAFGVEVSLKVFPALTSPGDITARSLAIAQRRTGFFEAEAVALQEPPDRVMTDFHTAPGQQVL